MPKIFLDTKFFRTKNLLDLTFVGPKLHLGLKLFYQPNILFWSHYFFGTKYFLTPDFFISQNFLTYYFSNLNSFEQNFITTTIFIPKRKQNLGPKSTSILITGVALPAQLLLSLCWL